MEPLNAAIYLLTAGIEASAALVILSSQSRT